MLVSLWIPSAVGHNLEGALGWSFEQLTNGGAQEVDPNRSCTASHRHNSNAAGLNVAEEGYLRINLRGKTRELQEWRDLVEEAIRLIMVQKSQPEVYLDLGLIESDKIRDVILAPRCIELRPPAAGCYGSFPSRTSLPRNRNSSMASPP